MMQCMGRNSRSQQGVVIVTALFFVALISVMAYLMMSRLERDTHRTHLLLRNTQAEFYAQASVVWAKNTLQTNLKNKKPNKIVDVIPIKLPTTEMNGYKISTVIFDMQALMNINNLTTDEGKKDFKHLLKILIPDMADEKIQVIMLAIVDWITPQRENEYDRYYFSLVPAYRAAHRPMVSISELRLIKGVTAKIYNTLHPWMTALPVNTKVNIQTASAPILAALSLQMNLEAGKKIEKIRHEIAIPTIQAFMKLDLAKNHEISNEKITDISNYFLAETTVSIENQQVLLYTLLERTGNESKNEVSIVWQGKSI